MVTIDMGGIGAGFRVNKWGNGWKDFACLLAMQPCTHTYAIELKKILLKLTGFLGHRTFDVVSLVTC